VWTLADQKIRHRLPAAERFGIREMRVGSSEEDGSVQGAIPISEGAGNQTRQNRQL